MSTIKGIRPFPRVVLLAAGQGSRLGAIAAGRPKALMPVAGEPLLLRTVRQLLENGFTDMTVVIGHMRAALEEALLPWRDRVEVVVNANFATDTNIGSLLCGLGESEAAALVIEADIAFDDEAVTRMAEAARGERSVWFTNGSFRNYRLGGCLRSDGNGRITDLRYVPSSGPEFADYRKLLGVVHVGSIEMPRFAQLLRTAASQTTLQYYMMPWCAHLSELPAWDCDLSSCRTATFNTPEDYQRCLVQFNPETEINHAY